MNHFEQQLKDHNNTILLDHVVKAIRKVENEEIEVETSQGTFTANRVICTIPLGVLQDGSIKFEPPLPERKLKALTRLGMGCLNKVEFHLICRN